MQRKNRTVLVELRFTSTLREVDADALLRLVRQTWRNNVACGITGEMRLQGTRVSQVIEGEIGAVLPIAARILGDVRHSAIEVAKFGAIELRRHSDWRVMGLSDDSSPGIHTSAHPVAIPIGSANARLLPRVARRTA